jgi:hypothetical protein
MASLPELDHQLFHDLDVMRTGVLADEMWARIELLLPSSDGLRGDGGAIAAR